MSEASKAKYKIHGFLLEPSSDGADKQGYIHFYDVFEASSLNEAREMAWEDYGEYNTLEDHGIAKNEADAKAWLAKNPD